MCASVPEDVEQILVIMNDLSLPRQHALKRKYGDS